MTSSTINPTLEEFRKKLSDDKNTVMTEMLIQLRPKTVEAVLKYIEIRLAEEKLRV